MYSGYVEENHTKLQLHFPTLLAVHEKADFYAATKTVTTEVLLNLVERSIPTTFSRFQISKSRKLVGQIRIIKLQVAYSLKPVRYTANRIKLRSGFY